MREAKEETDMDLEDLKQFHTYSKPGRDPRFRTVSTVFIARGCGTPQFGSDLVKRTTSLSEFLAEFRKHLRDFVQQVFAVRS